MLTPAQLRVAAAAIDKTFRDSQMRAQMASPQAAAMMDHPSIVGAAMIMNGISNALRAAATAAEAEATDPAPPTN